MPEKQMIREAVERYFSGIREGDAEGWVANFAEDAVSHDPVGARPYEGHEGLRRFFQGMNSNFESVALYAEEMFVAGDGAAVKWRGEATGKNGREVSFAGIDVFKVNDQGKIESVHAYWDPAAMMRELQGGG